MDKKLNMAVIGCGALAQMMHLPNIQRSGRMSLACVCDVDRSVAEDCRRRFGAARAETDWQPVVADPQIDAIVLATHPDIRGQVILPALRAGKPVYTEKPLAPSLPEMTEILYAARATRVPVCVGHNRRSSPAVLEFKRLVDKAARATDAEAAAVDRSGDRTPIPETQAMQLLFRVNDDVRSWKGWVFRDTEGILFGEMVHFVDLALWLNPSKPVRAFAEGSARGNFVLVLRFADGGVATFQHSLVGNFGYPKELMEATVRHVTIALDQHIEVRQVGLRDEPMLRTFPYARECAWATEQGMTGYFREWAREKRRAADAGESPRWLNVNKGHAAHLERFAQCVQGSGENPCDIADAVVVNRVTLKLLQSVRLGLPVAIGPEDWHIPE